MNPQAPFAEVLAPDSWRTVDFISDLHLRPGEPATVSAWRGYLQSTPADALFFLGDLFEVWPGDDAAVVPGFEFDCAAVLREASALRPIYFMHGNRDFLLGGAFAEQAGLTLLPDPTVLSMHGARWLLTHGDELCLADTDYLRFRSQVRDPAWQRALLQRPLSERRALARDIRSRSEQHKQQTGAVWADVDTAEARRWLDRAGARTMIHGHTHRPASHDLGDGFDRVVLSDWDATAHPPRAQVLCLGPAGLQRVDQR
ncbi:MAG: UDP-2,3-diacylglucosamine diphosphatase [Comamonadaceae bacterium]|nr:MAG: UDP-2,3-diacylglucosamine diphosphatase [Comamonadaceae bacterium]